MITPFRQYAHLGLFEHLGECRAGELTALIGIDDMGLRWDHQSGTSWGLKGHTPVVLDTGQRFRCNVISTITNRGTSRFRVFTGRFTADVFIDFIKRLVRTSERRVFLIMDRHPSHRAEQVKRWLARYPKHPAVFFAALQS